MSYTDKMPWDWLEARSATFFVVAVGMMVVAGAQKVLEATTEIALSDYFLNVAGQGGLTVSLVGLVALYPTVSDRMPKLAKISAVCSALGAVSFTVALGTLGAVLAVNAVAGTTLPAEVVGLLFLPGYLGAILGYLAFGVVSTRTGLPSRGVGPLFLLLILVPVGQVVWFLVVGSSLIQGNLAGLGLLDVWLPLVLLSVGVLLHTREPSNRGESTRNPTT